MDTLTEFVAAVSVSLTAAVRVIKEKNVRRILRAKIKCAVMTSLVAVATLGVATIAAGSSTTKTLDSNFTVVNLAGSAGSGVISYTRSDNSGGGAWPAANTTFPLAANGGQAIIRQYEDATLSSGAGSATVSADVAIGNVVQILARNTGSVSQLPSSGAYTGASATSTSWKIPLVMKRLNTTDGLGNSVVAVQNTSGAASDATITYHDSAGTSVFSKVESVGAGETFYHDLDDEAGLGAGFFGSASVSSAAQLATVSLLFLGADSMQVFNGFRVEDAATSYFAPLFTSRLANNLSTPIAVQNVSGGNIAAGAISVSCTPNAASSGAPFVKTNPSSLGNNQAVFFNPVTDLSMPAGFFGSCVIASLANIVTFVQMRFVGSGNAAAYEGIPGTGTDTTAVVPLVLQRLPNGFATALTIQNLDTGNTNAVTITYKPSAAYGGSAADVVVNSTIPSGGSSIQNHRLPGGVLPDGWFGSAVVTSDDARPLHSMIQITDYLAPPGDTFQAHIGFTF